MKNIISSLKSRLDALRNGISNKIKNFIDKRPFLSFLGILLFLFIAVVVSNKLRQPPKEAVPVAPAPKTVQTFHLTSNPELRVQAKIEKSGVIKLVAQTSGVVQKIKKVEGEHVKRGTTIFSLSTSYQGGNIPSLNKQVSKRNYKFQLDTYDNQKNAIEQQRQIALKNETQASQLRSISRQSIDETNSLINLDNDIIASLDAQIQNLQNTNVGGANDSLILQAKQAKMGTLTSLNIAKSAVRNTIYLSDDNNEPAQVAALQRDVTLKQLDTQAKMVDLNKDLSQLNLRISQVSEQLMFPASPCPGTIERIYVKVGQVVNPGTVLASIRGDMNTATAIALVSGDVTQNISRVAKSTLYLPKETISLSPQSISLEPTDGTLHSVIYQLPEEHAAELADGEFVEVSLPVGALYSTHLSFVPLDAVYQTQDAAYVYVVTLDSNQHQVATVRTVTLGNVYGHYIEVKSGLEASDKVITDRNVVGGETVTPAQ